MKLYIIITLVLIVFVLILKRSKKFKIKDYSSNKLQNRTILRDIGGFSFSKSDSNEQIKHDCRILNNILINATTLNVEKKNLLKKLISNIKNKKFSFHNLNYDNAINVVNLSLDDISDLVSENKNSILRKMFPSYKDLLFNFNQKVEEAKEFGLDEKDLKQWLSKLYAKEIVRSNFFSDEQYLSLEKYIENVDKLALEIPKTLNDEQLNEISKHYIDYKDLAEYFIFHGKKTIYRFSSLKKVLPEEFFDDINRDPLVRILKGIDDIDKKDFSIIKNANLNFFIPEFIPQNKIHKNFAKAVKKLTYVNAFNDHDQILDSFINIEKRFIKIPKTLVNFDLQPDIYINKQITEQCIANWINIAIKDYSINNIYWVIPETGLFDPFIFDYYFGENTSNDINFKGNLNINKVYKNLSKPLSQRFLFDTFTASIDSESVKYSDEEFKSQLKTGKYKEINIHICTTKNLPKINKDFILSIDGDYFYNCGFDSPTILERIPFDTQKIFDEFLSLYCKKLSNATITCMSISPEKIGFDNIGPIRGFYEYILKTVQKHSKKVY